jgi:DEAD/DEAH box helicase domain-containing protein
LGLQASFEQLFSHQAEALRLLGEGKHVVLTTSTSSGKSLVCACGHCSADHWLPIVQCYDHSYQAAFLEALERNPESTAILIFPTKALANDQLSSIKRIFNQKARQDAVRGGRRCGSQ